MVEELRGIRRKLDQADLALNAGSEFLDKLAGREEEPGSDAQKLVSQLMAEGRRVRICVPIVHVQCWHVVLTVGPTCNGRNLSRRALAAVP